MGCWNESCGVTGLPVTVDGNVRYMVIGKVKRSKDDHAVFYPFDIFQPVSILVKGEYDDYGGVTLTAEDETALFESLKECGVKVTEAVRHGNIRVNDEEYHLPVDHYHWFVREDAFQMLNDLPLRDSKKTLASSQKDTLDKVMKIADELGRKSGIFGSLMGGYEISQAFGRLEMPQPPIYPILTDKVVTGIVSIPEAEAKKILDDMEKGGPPADYDALLAKFPKPDLTLVPERAQPLLDLNRILYGMLILRKQLHPTGGAGSQAWNDTAYEVYGEFVAKTARDYRKQFDE